MRPGDDGRARYARRPFHDSPLGSPALAAAAETVHQAKARGHRRKMNPMMGKGQARYTFTRYHRSRLRSSKFLLLEQSRLPANCPRHGFATGSTRRLSRFHVAALHRAGKSLLQITACFRKAPFHFLRRLRCAVGGFPGLSRNEAVRLKTSLSGRESSS